MDDKVSKAPMIALITATAGGLLIFSIAQFREKKSAQEIAINALQAEHAKTEAVMRNIGEKAETEAGVIRQDKKAAYRRTAAAQELKRLEAEDRAATALPRSTPPR
jgi:hypothetical protein